MKVILNKDEAAKLIADSLVTLGRLPKGRYGVAFLTDKGGGVASVEIEPAAEDHFQIDGDYGRGVSG